MRLLHSTRKTDFMKNRKHLFEVAVTLFAWCISSAAALPGFTPYIKDVSGEYVYYQDKTFNRESYIGFLYYNDSTYGVRYYAPEDKNTHLVEKSVEILFSLDPAADHVELTGEKIITPITASDTNLVNYIHDMFYEFNSRRIKAGTVFSNDDLYIGGNEFALAGLSVSVDFPQFGGPVAIIYDNLVPLFNIKTIVANDGKQVLQTVTTGQLHSSDDKSFSSFKGMPEKFSDRDHRFKSDEKAKQRIFRTADGQCIVLDTQWMQSMDNLWLLGDNAILSAVTISPEKGKSTVSGDAVLRKILQSAEGSYINWRNISVEKKGGRYSSDSIFYQPESGTVTRTFRVLTSVKGGFCFFTLTVFNSVYETNHGYFDQIVSNYSAFAEVKTHE
jgi:hypothetical protein